MNNKHFSQNHINSILLFIGVFLITANPRITFAQTDESIKTFVGHSWVVTSVSFSPDGKYALSGSADATLKLWDIAAGLCLKTFTVNREYVNSVSFSTDGKYALSSSGTNTRRLWDITTGLCLKTFKGYIYVSSVSFSPDCKLALSGGINDAALRL